MPEQKTLNDHVIDSLLKSALVSSVDVPKLKTSLHSLLGVTIPVEELRKLETFHQLFEKAKAEHLKSNTL